MIKVYRLQEGLLSATEVNANYPFGCNSCTENAPWNEQEAHECGECYYYEAAPFVNAGCGVCTWEGNAIVGGLYWVLETEDACEGWKE